MEKILVDLIKATDADNEQLLQFFSQQTIPGTIQLQVRRMQSFFNQYRLQSDQFSTYLLRNSQNEIEAMASFVFRKGYIDGEEQTIGYATDLRVMPHRRAILSWTQHFLPVLEAERNANNCKYIFSVVAKSQRQAINAFIRPRGVKRPMPRYHLLKNFKLNSLHGLWPFHQKPLPGIITRTATSADVNALCDFIVGHSKRRPLYYYDNKQDIVNALARWRGLNWENFIVAFDSHGKIIGCVAPWSPSQVQRLVAAGYDPKAKNMQDALSVMSLLRFSKPLPKEGSELQVQHLTHLFADNPDILYSLFYAAYKRLGKKEFMTYPHFDGELHTAAPRSFLSAEKDYGLYCILAPTDPIPEFLKPRAVYTPPVFEPAFI